MGAENKIEYAGFWRRSFSLGIDGLFGTQLPIFLLSLVLNLDYFKVFYIYGTPVGLFTLLMEIFFLWKWGQTPGKMFMGIKVLKIDLTDIALKEAVLRYSFNLLSVGYFMLLWFEKKDHDIRNNSLFVIGLLTLWGLSEPIVLLFNEKKRALHDFIASTVVVVQKDKVSAYSKGLVAFSIAAAVGVVYFSTRISAREARAEAGDVQAQVYSGSYYAERKDYEAALKWFTKAAEQGDPIAENNLGWMYENGFGVTLDYHKAYDLYMKAVAQTGFRNMKGRGLAEQALGALFEYGRGQKTNMEEAIKWYRLAAKDGDRQARQDLKRLGVYSY